MLKLPYFVLLTGILMSLHGCAANAKQFDPGQLDEFIRSMSESHEFDRNDLTRLFANVNYTQEVIDAITRPAERLPWHRYKQIFLTDDRINAGTVYWREHAETLARVEEHFGVPPEIIVAIIGVETRYGTHKGRHKVLDSLATLAFDYPPRAAFFRRELEQYLILTREQRLDPLAIRGSYAGAMGIPQFISSSYRHYAIDFSGNGQVDLLNSHVDAIGSVANYFKRHGWASGEPVAFHTNLSPVEFSDYVTTSPKPETAYAELRRAGVNLNTGLDDNAPVTLLEFDEADRNELWLVTHNFYVITRYNHSSLYALAVYLLAQEIKRRYQS